MNILVYILVQAPKLSSQLWFFSFKKRFLSPLVAHFIVLLAGLYYLLVQTVAASRAKQKGVIVFFRSAQTPRFWKKFMSAVLMVNAAAARTRLIIAQLRCPTLSDRERQGCPCACVPILIRLRGKAADAEIESHPTKPESKSMHRVLNYVCESARGSWFGELNLIASRCECKWVENNCKFQLHILLSFARMRDGCFAHPLIFNLILRPSFCWLIIICSVPAF